MKLLHIIGVTNSGKTTLMDIAERLPGVGVVEVGRILRAKYPPEYFKGSGNPAHTAAEAWQIYCDTITKHDQDRKIACFISGQPRDMKQLQDLQNQFMSKYDCRFINMFASSAELERRARKRDTGEALDLSLQRLKNDPPKLLEIINVIHSIWPHRLQSVNTEASGYNPVALAKNLI